MPTNRVPMNGHRRAVVATVLLIAAATGVAACSSSGSSSKSKSTTTTAARTYSLSTSEGEVTVSLDGELPSGWPSGFPVPSGAKPAGSGSVAGKSDGVMVAVYTLSSGSTQDVYNFYKSNSALTVDKSSSAGGTNAFVGSVTFSGTYSGSVTIGSIGSANGFVVVLDSAGTSGSTTSSSTAA